MWVGGGISVGIRVKVVSQCSTVPASHVGWHSTCTMPSISTLHMHKHVLHILHVCMCSICLNMRMDHLSMTHTIHHAR